MREAEASMRVLITGASGQLGAYLVRQTLSSNCSLVAWSGASSGELFGVPLRLHLRKDPGDSPFAINYKRGALDAHHLFAIHILLFENPKSGNYLLLWISQQGIGQIVLLLEFLLRLRRIGRYAEHACSGLLYLLECVAEPARLNRSARSICFRKEEEHHGFSFKIFKRDLLALLIQKSKIRSFVVDFHAVPFHTIS